MSELISMPIGFRFDPTDEELISGFLLRKVMGLPLPWNGFLERDLYGENAAPCDVFGDIDESSVYWHKKKEGENSKVTKKTIYVFTKLTKIGSSSNSKRISRRAGFGTWNGQTSPRKIKDSNNGKIIGSTRMLTFQHSKTSAKSSSDTHWIMHEYCLDGVLSSTGGGSSIVLCKITKCRRGAPQPVTPQSCISMSGDGGASDLQIPTTTCAQQPASRQFCISMSGDGGASDIQISTATRDFEAAETRNERCAEERHYKKQKYDYEGNAIDIILEGMNIVQDWDIEAVQDWDIEAVLQGL